MPRKRPADRFQNLIETATRVFIEAGGYDRTQIEDVARALGVAKGTVYLYVESKEALFDLCLRHADAEVVDEPEVLPVPTPPEGATFAFVRERVGARGRFPALERALAQRGAGKDARGAARSAKGAAQSAGGAAQSASGAAKDARAELTEILEQIYDTLAAGKTRIRLIAAAARDVPELAEAWFEGGRKRLNERLARYVFQRAESGHFRSVPDAKATARLISETLTWFAVHRHWEPAPDAIDDEAARATAVLAMQRMLLVQAP